MIYHVKQKSEFKNLKEHLDEYGQIENVIVYNDGVKEYIIDGAKRVKLFKNPQKTVLTDLITSYKLILSSKTIPDSSIWKMILKLKNDIDEKAIYERLLKGRVKISIRDIWKLTQIDYSESLENSFYNLNISLKELKTYYSLKNDELIALFDLFEKNGLNKNSRNDFYLLLTEIAKIDNISIVDLLKRDRVTDIINSELQNKDKMKVLKKLLFSFRYPNINKEIEYLTSLKFKLKTPSVRLDIPIDIESNICSVSFNFKNLDDLKKRVQTLSELSNDENFEKILDVISKR